MIETTARPISPLRVRMIEDMNVRNFVPATQREYIRAVTKLAAFLGRSPDTATVEELRGFQVHLSEVGANPGVINATVTALRFFFNVTVGKPEATRLLAFVFEPKKLPRIAFAVGTAIADRPPHRSERARFGHSAPTLSV